MTYRWRVLLLLAALSTLVKDKLRLFEGPLATLRKPLAFPRAKPLCAAKGFVVSMTRCGRKVFTTLLTYDLYERAIMRTLDANALASMEAVALLTCADYFIPMGTRL
jgi:hypothetical protein